MQVFFILGTLLLPAHLLKAEGGERSLAEQVADLDNEFYRNDEKTVARASELLQQIDQQADLKSFLIAWLYANEEARHKAFSGTPADALKLAKKFNYADVSIYLMMNQVDESAQTIKREEAERIYAEAIKLCQGEAGLCGRVYTAWSRYLYFVGDNGKAFQMAEQAVNLLGRSKDRKDQIHYHMAKGTLANLLSSQLDQKQAIRIAEENFNWYVENGFLVRAIFMALNLASYHLGTSDLKMENIKNYLKRAEQLASEINDDNAKASIREVSGRLHMKAKKYRMAIVDWKEALAVYQRLKVKDMVSMTKNSIAKAYIHLNELDQVEPLLDSAAKDLPEEARHEQSQILETRKELALARKDYFDAFVQLDHYFQLWKIQKEEEDKVNLQKISADIGLELEGERNRVLQQQSVIQNQKIKDAERFRIFTIVLSGLLLGIIGLLVVAYKQSRRIKSSQARMKHILDTIDEGLVMVDMQQKIGSEYSQHLQSILETDEHLENQNVVSQVFAKSQLPQEDLSVIHEVLQVSFGEDRLAWDMNEGNLPREMSMKGDADRIIAIRWMPVFVANRGMTKVLISLRDVTHERELERRVGEQNKHIKGLPQTLKELLQLKPDRIMDLLNRTGAVLEQVEKEGARASVLRELHTQKGAARTLGMRTLSHELHDLETLLEPKTGGLTLGHHLTQQILQTRERLDEYRNLTQVIHGQQAATLLLTLADAVTPHLSAWLKQMKEAHLPWQELQIIDGILEWPEGLLTQLGEVLLHAINNSLDHGYTFPKQRGLQPNAPTIQVIARQQGTGMRIEIRDNGVGLDVNKLQKLAEKRGFKPQGEQTVVDVVFLDGVSTAEKISLTSGRGVGLAAVKEKIQELGGQVWLRPNDQGSGSLLLIELPPGNGNGPN